MLEINDGNQIEWALLNACNHTSLGYQYELLDFTDGYKKLSDDMTIMDCYVINVYGHHTSLFQTIPEGDILIAFENPENDTELLTELVSHKEDKSLLTELNDRYLYEQVYLNKDYCILNVTEFDGRDNWLIIRGGEVKGSFGSYDDIVYHMTDLNGTEVEKHLSELKILKAYQFDRESAELTNKP